MILRKLKINCGIKGKIVTARECMNCSLCLPKPILKKILRGFEFRPNEYGVTELVGCLRRSYFARTTEIYPTLGDVYVLSRGLAYHDFFGEYFDLNEVRLYKRFKNFSVIGIVDGISRNNRKTTMFEIKSVTRIPKSPYPHHILQLQSYYSLGKESIQVDNLEIVYLSMNRFKVFEVEKKDVMDIILKRAEELHMSLMKKVPPKTVNKDLCYFCPFRNLCLLEESVKEFKS